VKFLLDTNVVSELRKRERADPGVRAWFDAVAGDDLAVSVLVLGEIRLGILRLRMRDPVTADLYAAWLGRVERAYVGRTLPVDSQVAESWAALSAPRPLPVVDSLQAATARVHGLTFVTRNVSDLDGVEVALLNPFSG
jgi:hypothetical protein